MSRINFLSNMTTKYPLLLGRISSAFKEVVKEETGNLFPMDRGFN